MMTKLPISFYLIRISFKKKYTYSNPQFRTDYISFTRRHTQLNRSIHCIEYIVYNDSKPDEREKSREFQFNEAILEIPSELVVSRLFINRVLRDKVWDKSLKTVRVHRGRWRA